MSVISNIHTAIVYEAKGANKTTAYNGQRLVVTIAKADKEGNYGEHLQQTMATSIPTLESNGIDWTNSRIQSACVEYFQTVQNSIVATALKSGAKTVTTEQLEQSAILSYLESESTGDKWDSARIAAWFNDSLAEQIFAAQISKGIAEDIAVQNMTAYGKKFAGTFSSKAAISRKLALLLQKALVLADKNDAVAKRFTGRIDKVLIDSSVEESLGL